MNDYANPVDTLVHSTVRLSCVHSNGKEFSGTGYLFAFCEDEGMVIPCIVTNKHVVEGAVKGVFNLTLRSETGRAQLGQHERVGLSNLERFCIKHPNPEIDLAAIPIGPVLNNASRNGTDYFFAPLSRKVIASPELLQSLSTMEDIVMIGYPNGLWDETHNLPIIRRGVTATHARLPLNGKPEFLIDAACFPGSSGSPVFLVNVGGYGTSAGWVVGDRVALLGTLYAGPQHTTEGQIVVVNVPTDTKSIALGTVPNNLGYVVQASELVGLEQAIKARFGRTALSARNSRCFCGSDKRYKDCCGKLL